MLKRFIVSLCVGIVACFGVMGSIHASRAPQVTKLTTIQSFIPPQFITWKQLSSIVTSDGFGTKEWIPAGSSVGEWSERLRIKSISFDPENKKNARTLFHALHDTAQKKGLRWDLLDMKDNDVLYETITTGPKPFFQELGRIITTDKGYYLITYTRSDEPLNEQQHAQWMQFMTSISIH